MTTDNVRTLVRYRIEQADDALNAARLLPEQRSLRAALLALRKQETSKHAGAISLFDREFIRPGGFSKDLSQWLHHVFEQRLVADYAPLSTLSDDKVQQVFEEARAFVVQVKVYLAQELER